VTVYFGKDGLVEALSFAAGRKAAAAVSSDAAAAQGQAQAGTGAAGR
jgi:hypothetical protein